MAVCTLKRNGSANEGIGLEKALNIMGRGRCASLEKIKRKEMIIHSNGPDLVMRENSLGDQKRKWGQRGKGVPPPAPSTPTLEIALHITVR